MNLYTIHDHSLIAWYFLPICTKMSNWRALSFFFCLETCVFVTQCIAPPRRLCHNAFVDRYKELLSFVWIIDLPDFAPTMLESCSLECHKVSKKQPKIQKKWLPKFQNLLPKSLDIFL